jgi:3',5'-nucleoside bisphosphate phosphatase
MNSIDLHIHSNYSADGELTVREIVDISKRQGMKTIAITDHNCVQGIEEAVSYGKQVGLEVIPGIELDCKYQSVNLHLLGYYIDWHYKEYTQLQKHLYEQEMDAFPKMIHNLHKLGILVTEAEVLNKAKGGVPCGELIAEVLLHKVDSAGNELLKPYFPGGSRSNMPYLNFYHDFFAQGRAAHVPIQYMHVKDAIDLIKQSNGIPVIAHPGNNLKDNMAMIDELIQVGVEGIEVYSNYHTPVQVEYFHKKALVNELLITCGSDFHGKNKPGIYIGSCDGYTTALTLGLREEQ